MARAFLIVLDSVGIGSAPDAVRYGDEGSDTVGHIALSCAAGHADRAGVREGQLRLPNLAQFGLGEACSQPAACRRALKLMLRPWRDSVAQPKYPPARTHRRAIGRLRERLFRRIGTISQTPPPLFPPTWSRDFARKQIFQAFWAIVMPQARRSSLVLGQSTSAPANPSATPRRTACSRSPRTRKRSGSSGCTRFAMLRGACSMRC